MAKKKTSRGIAKPASKKAAKKVAARSRAQSSGRRGAVKTSGTASPIAVPKEWQGGRIVLAKPPAKPLKGRWAERLAATAIRDTEGRSIPRKVSDWFVRKLDGSHKVLVRSFDHYEAPKDPYLSPEAAHVLQENAAAWAKLMEAEKADATKREQESLDSLATTQAPKEFQNSKVVLAKPQKPVAEAHCWKPDFAGEIYPAVLHYYGYLPDEHVGSIRDPNGYPAKAMSPEAAELYRAHRTFWEAKHAESKASSKTASAARKRAAKATIEKAATSAGLSKVELTTKLDRLGMLVEKGHLQLVADMISGFGDTWLYEALLAGSAINPKGDLMPGKILKRFKGRATFVLVLALAFMPDGVAIDPSLRRDATLTLDVTADTVDIVADIATRLPNLQVRPSDLDDLEELLPQTAALLATCRESLGLWVTTLGLEAANNLATHTGALWLVLLEKIDPEVAAALARHQGDLSIGLTELPEAVAANLAPHRGELELPDLRTISAAAAAALTQHSGLLTLGGEHEFKLDASAAQHLAQHAGPVSLPTIKEFPAGSAGVKLCERLATSCSNHLYLWDLKTLSAECASVLAGFPGTLSLAVRTWSDEAILALAKCRGELELRLKSLSAAAATALAQRDRPMTLSFSEFYPLSLGDEAAECLKTYQGELKFWGKVEMSSKAANSLVQRKSLVLFRTKIKPSIRRIFQSAGTWKGCVWTRLPLGRESD